MTKSNFPSYAGDLSPLGREAGDHPREGDRLAYMAHARDPADYPLEPVAESRMHHGAVLPEIQVPLEGAPRELELLEALQQRVVVVLAL